MLTYNQLIECLEKKIMILNQPNLTQLNESEKQEHNNQKTNDY